MQIVIDITDNKYQEIIKCKEMNLLLGQLEKIIANGTILPEHHGRLIILSGDALKREQTHLSFSRQKWISEIGLSNATVAIIEADKSVIEDAIIEEAEEYEADLDN